MKQPLTGRSLVGTQQHPRSAASYSRPTSVVGQPWVARGTAPARPTSLINHIQFSSVNEEIDDELVKLFEPFQIFKQLPPILQNILIKGLITKLILANTIVV